MQAEEWTSQVSEYVQSQARPNEVNFALGQPARPLLPLGLMRQAAAHHFRASADPLVLQYGHPQGYRTFRQDLAAYLSQELDHPVPLEELFITNGNSGALAFVLSVLCPKGGQVYCEEATYFLAKGIFEHAGMSVRAVPCDQDGLCVDALAELADRNGVPDIVYVIPTFQNPTGTVMPEQRRAALADLAAARGFTVISDEPYNLLWYSEPRPPPSLAAYDRQRGHVLALGSFSKILAPGLRLGWAQAAPRVVQRLIAHGSLQSGGCFNPVMGGIVHASLQLGLLQSHVATLRRELGERAARLTAALRAELPEVRFNVPRGGYFVWCQLPGGVDAERLLQHCASSNAGVAFYPGVRSCPERVRFKDRFRLSFSFYTPKELEIGVQRLRAALASFLPVSAGKL